MPDDRAATASSAATRGLLSTPLRLVPVAVIVALSVLAYAMGLHRQFTLEMLVKHRSLLESVVADHFLWALAGFMAIYLVIAVLSLPGFLFLTIAGGFLFGVLIAAPAVVVAATIGAIIIFLIARSAFGDVLIRLAGPRVARLAAGFRADAFHYLLFLRVVPVFPFFLVNLAAALFGVGLRPFIAATVIGMIPPTIALSLVGAGLNSVIAAEEAAYAACLAAHQPACRLDFDINAAFTPQILLALGTLGVLALVPVVVRRVYGKSW